jgi:hypothetical protein
MPKFRKKPVVIEAVQYTGRSGKVDDLYAFSKWMVDRQGNTNCHYRGETLIIPTLEGAMEASPGDWIICGVKGELYPCKPDIFEATYDPVHEVSAAMAQQLAERS